MAEINTLRRQQDFDCLFASGKRYYDKLLMTVVGRRPERDHTRVAFIVGAKVDKRAIVRNRIKRRLREAWRREVPQPLVSADIAFVASSASATASYSDLAEVMKAHLTQAGLLDDDSDASADSP